MLIAIVGCWTESNIAYDLQDSPTADWIFVKTAEKFEVWCEDRLVSVSGASTFSRNYRNKVCVKTESCKSTRFKTPIIILTVKTWCKTVILKLTPPQFLNKNFIDGSDGCSEKMGPTITHVKFRLTVYDYSKKIKFAIAPPANELVIGRLITVLWSVQKYRAHHNAVLISG